jgi:hypothetical protein
MPTDRQERPPFIDPHDPARFRVHMIGGGSGFAYELLDRGTVIERGEATAQRIVWLLFEDFKRGRLSAEE